MPISAKKMQLVFEEKGSIKTFDPVMMTIANSQKVKETQSEHPPLL